MPKSKCLVCQGDVKERERDGSIKCSQCDRWIHTGCTTLSPELVKELWAIYDASGRHFWACEGCTSAFANMNKRMMMFEKEMAEMKLAVRTNAVGVKEVTEKVDKVAKDVDDAKKNRKKDNYDLIAEATKRMSAELRERESMKNNLVLHGLYEPPQSVKGRDRKTADLSMVGELFSAMSVNADTATDIKFSYRLGQISDAVYEVPRPLCIGLQSTSTRDQILQKAKNLNQTRDFYGISIVPDLTVQQRAEDKALVQEAESKNREMSEEDQGNWTYRCIGMKGQRTIARLRVNKDQEGSRPPRGGQRSRGSGNRRPAADNGGRRPTADSGGRGNHFTPHHTPFTGANRIPVQHRPQSQEPPPPGDCSDSEEEFSGFPTIDQSRQTRKRHASTSPSISPGMYPARSNQNTRKRGRGQNLRFGAANL